MALLMNLRHNSDAEQRNHLLDNLQFLIVILGDMAMGQHYAERMEVALREISLNERVSMQNVMLAPMYDFAWPSLAPG
jgi:hypothetical protein